MSSIILHMHKNIFVAMVDITIQRYVQISIKDIESLLHIWMNMRQRHLTCLQVSNSNLS